MKDILDILNELGNEPCPSGRISPATHRLLTVRDKNPRPESDDGS